MYYIDPDNLRVRSSRPRTISMKCTRTCRTKTGNENKCARFADEEDLGWMKKFCVISNIDPDNKDTCKGDSGSNILLYMTYIKIKIMLTVENVYT